MLQTLKHKAANYSMLPRVIPIAPAPEKNYLLGQQEIRRCTNKSNPYTGSQAASIARRNARERNRVKQVNDSFNALRKRLPAAVVAALSGGSRRGSGKKLSKVDTLRMVVEYIRYLENVIEESDSALGITNETKQSYETNETVFSEISPYSDQVPSPCESECSSGVSSAYSSNGYYNSYQVSNEKLSPMEEEDLLDAITWWQEK